MQYHEPVLLKDCMDGLKINPEGTYVDVTFGGGGHSREIFKQLTSGKLIAFDQDKDALKNKINDARFILEQENFASMNESLKKLNVGSVDGLIADLGVSSHQFDDAGRGFSTRFEASLDMRMDQRTKKTAVTVINTYSENELKKIFSEYGEIENSNQLARTIFSYRKNKKIESTSDLKQAVDKCVKRGKENQYYAQLFQALRIEVNNELEVLKQMLIQSAEIIKPAGRLVVMSYHSLEDRLVKNFMRSGHFDGTIDKDFYGNIIKPFKALTSKPIVPTDEEINKNSRARSAKLRIAEKI